MMRGSARGSAKRCCQTPPPSTWRSLPTVGVGRGVEGGLVGQGRGLCGAGVGQVWERVWVTCTVLKFHFLLLPYPFARFHHSQRFGDTIHNSPLPPASPLPADMVHSQHFGDAIRNLVVNAPPLPASPLLAFAYRHGALTALWRRHPQPGCVALPGSGRGAQGQKRGDAHQPGVGGSVGVGASAGRGCGATWCWTRGTRLQMRR